MKNKIRQTITRKYKLGKQGNFVSVLIKNGETRRNIQKEQGLLKKKSINEIKKYLYDKKLLKVGSDAPPDVLRNMYENAIMSGDVNNINGEVLLHNFISSNDKDFHK